ncbi:MAG: TonB-dependent receptor [Muribaculaceae bacterium]|nr:TonB-dependent receptor [Muribaculaceae bacterium]
MKKRHFFSYFYRRLVSAVVMLSVCVTIYAYNITGTLTDTQGEPLIGASIRLMTPKDSTVVRTTVADASGRFTLKDVSKGRYIAEMSYIGSATKYQNITVDNSNVNLKPIQLSEDAVMLNETVVTGIRTPIKVMEDTIEYSAETYKVQPNAVVEDLLKRLPGVEVGADGSITSNGKTISKILVDGKEFFSDDPTVASKNLPVDMVEKVQVVDRKSDLARLTGVDDGEEETVINLTVKKGMKNGWFGNAEAGYGTDSRYKGSFVVNKFWDGNQITFLGGLNNINEPGFTDGASGRFRRFGGDNGLTRSKALGLNFNVGKEEIIRVGGNVMYSHTDRRTTTRQDRQYLTEPTQYLYSNKYAKDQGHNFRADFRLQWKPDSSNTIDFRPNMSFNSNRSFSNDSSVTRNATMSEVTRSLNNSNSKGTSWEFGAQLTFNHNFRSHPGRSFSVFASIRTSNVREKENSYSWNRFYLFNDSTDIYDQTADNHTWSNNFSARATWTEPLGDPKKGHFLTLAYRFAYRWNNADKITYDREIDWPFGWDADPVLGDTIYNPELSNRFRNNYMNQDIRLGYKYVNSKTNLEVGISAVPQMSKSIDLINSAKNIERNIWNYAPFLRYRYKMSKTRSMNIDYRGQTSQPSMTQLQPVIDMSNPLHIVIGNPSLDPSFTHNIRFRFQDFDQKAQRSIMAMVNASVVQNSIVSSTTYDYATGSDTTTYRNVNGAWSAMGGLMFSAPLRNRTWTTSVQTMLNYDHPVGFNNGRRNVSSSFRINVAPGIAWRPDHLQFELRPRYGLQTVNNTVATTSNRTVHNYGGRFDGTFYTDFGLTVNTDLSYTATSGYTQGYDTKSWMWNAEVSYSFLRGQNATVAVRAYDILGMKSNIQRSVTANYITDTEYDSLTRYVMVSFSYRFNTFGKGNEPDNRNEFRGGPGGPPPGAPPAGGRPGGRGGRPL